MIPGFRNAARARTSNGSTIGQIDRVEAIIRA